jgi:hypothetical protein
MQFDQCTHMCNRILDIIHIEKIAQGRYMWCRFTTTHAMKVGLHLVKGAKGWDILYMTFLWKQQYHLELTARHAKMWHIVKYIKTHHLRYK